MVFPQCTHFAQLHVSAVEVIDLGYLPKTLLVFIEWRVLCFPLHLEDNFRTPVYHLAFDFCEFILQTSRDSEREVKPRIKKTYR